MVDKYCFSTDLLQLRSSYISWLANLSSIGAGMIRKLDYMQQVSDLSIVKTIAQYLNYNSNFFIIYKKKV